MTVSKLSTIFPKDPKILYSIKVKKTNPMTVSYQTQITDEGYNGWSNYETWNVSLWILNDEGLYNFAQECKSYDEVIAGLWECGSKETPDGVKWNSPKVNQVELNEMMKDL
jgi:hypothetical protein